MTNWILPRFNTKNVVDRLLNLTQHFINSSVGFNLYKIMKKIYFIFCLVSLISFSGNTQTLISSDRSYSPNKYIAVDLDQFEQVFFYDYTYLRIPDNPSSEESSLTMLQVGDKYSKFTDYFKSKLDSVKEAHSHLKRLGSKEINEQLSYKKKIGFKPSVINDFNESKFIIQARIPSNDYEYTIDEPELQWELTSSFKSILSYRVQKATVNYAGRNWVAWFTESIPINKGPYIFGDLPGLILELYDQGENFHFVISGINGSAGSIYKRNEEKILKISEKEYLRLNKSFHKKPGVFIKSPSNFKSDLEELPYNPIELDK